MIARGAPIIVSSAVTHPAVMSVAHVWMIRNMRSRPVRPMTMVRVGVSCVIARPAVITTPISTIGDATAICAAVAVGIGVGAASGPAGHKGGAELGNRSPITATLLVAETSSVVIISSFTAAG